MTDFSVFHGRMRPYGEQHHHNVVAALDHGQYAILSVGSINEPINFRNPWTFAEVREMIRRSLTAEQADRVFIIGVEDYDTDLKWVTAVQRQVHEIVERVNVGHKPVIKLIGHSKDDSSYYLDLFPGWGSINTPSFKDGISATDLRNLLYEAGMGEGQVAYGDPNAATLVERLHKHGELPLGTYLFLREWVHTEAYQTMRAEYLFNVAESAKFPPNPYSKVHKHTTADSVCFNGGSVLLVRRGEMPGQGLWALPGGHIQDYERFQAAAIRELCEETQIDVLNGIDKNYLNVRVKGEKLLDDPWRSTRMRTIGMAYGIVIEGADQPLVKGTDDAKEARWWPLDQVTRPMMFEDHFNIIQHFATRFDI